MMVRPSFLPDAGARRKARRRASGRRRSRLGAVAWGPPALALASLVLGERFGDYLLVCMLVGAAVSAWCARRSQTAAWGILWSLSTAAFAGALLLFEVPALPSLRLLAWATAGAQAIALLGWAAPATVAGWRARGLALAALGGPLALALLASKPSGAALVASLAIGLNLAGPPLASWARDRATPRQGTPPS